jgi:hypothetical protein
MAALFSSAAFLSMNTKAPEGALCDCKPSIEKTCRESNPEISIISRNLSPDRAQGRPEPSVRQAYQSEIKKRSKSAQETPKIRSNFA